MIGYLIPFLFAFPALVFWILEKPLSIRFINNIATFTSLGQIFGLIGACLLIYVIFFSTRPKFLEDKFGGLDKIYKSHHQIGVVAWILLLLHPLMLSFVQIRFSIIKVFSYFIPIKDFPTNLGIFALLLMIVLLMLTLFFRPTFKIWKFTHKFLSLALSLGVLHALLIGSDISKFLPLKIYMTTLLLVGICAALYQIFLSGILRKKYKYEVRDILIRNRIADITLSPINNTIAYKPGQFIFIEFISKFVTKESHPFSIAPGEGNSFRIIVKLQGDYTNLLDKLEIGSIALVEGPYGRFSNVKSNNTKQIWIGGGIGIVPFLSMVKNISKGSNIDIYYLAKNKLEALYLNEILSYAKDKVGVNVIPYFSENEGHINFDKIKRVSKYVTNSEFFICGPKRMTESLVKNLEDNGISKKSIHFELFEY